MIGVLRPEMGVGDFVQPKFMLRKFFAVCLLAMVAQVGVAGNWDDTNHTMTYSFNVYQTTFNLSRGSVICGTIGDKDLYTMEDIDNGTFYHALDAIFAAQNVENWAIQQDATGHHLYQGGNGNRYLSISSLFSGVTISITYDNSTEGKSITFVDDDNYIQSPAVTDHVLVSGTTYTLKHDGPLELVVPRWVKIRSITINYSNHHLLFKRDNENIKYYKDNIPYFRCQLSSRDFTEPTTLNSTLAASLAPDDMSISTVETPSGYDPAVLKTHEVTEGGVTSRLNDVPYEVMMNNLGVSQVSISCSEGTDSYRLEIWDNIASTSVTPITSGSDVIGHKFQLTGPGVLANRTITDVPGIEVRFSVSNEGNEPNTTIVHYDEGHYVSFTNDEYGWWDRVPQDNYSWPTGGTFYSFKATAKGKLKFGGNKKNPSSGTAGKVYLVKLEKIEEDGKMKDIYPKAYLFTAGQSGYLSNEQFTSITYSTHKNDANEDISDASSYNITSNATPATNNCIELKTGEVYYLQGEANSSGNTWAPYLLEWFSYELDDELRINKTFAVANTRGHELTSTTDGGTTKYSYTATDVVVTGTPDVGCFVRSGEDLVWTLNATDVKGSITSAKARLNTSTHHIEFYDIFFSETEDHKMGGAIKVRLKTSESNYIDFTLTIPYGKHVWDFRQASDQVQVSGGGTDCDWSYTDVQLCSMMKANSAANWKIAWKVRKNDDSQFEDPIMVPDGTINGDNAFCMDNTAGLVFVAGARSLGARDTRSLSGVDPNDVNAGGTTATNLLWLKGNATIYFPGVTAGQYIKIYTYRHSDDKGETFWAKNLVDLDNKAYDPNDKFIMHGMWEERDPAYKGDNIKGCAIFRVPSTYSATTDFDNIPQLTLCDDGWMKIYRIEIMDNFEPDIILTDDNPGGAFCPVDYDGKFGSVVVRKKNGVNVPTLKSYLAVVGQTQCMHANTCDYQIIADQDVVDVNKEVWTSGGGVNYNKLNLKYKKSGLVRIVQRERANIVGTSNNWTETGKDSDGNLIYEGSDATAPGSLPTGYVTDKNEYYINVGELTVQDYPYTWDFTNYNMYQGASTTKSNLSGSGWTVSDNTCSQTAIVQNVNFGADQTINYYNSSVSVSQTPQVKSFDRALFPQGAQLMNNTGTAIAETEGLGVSRPKTSKSFNYYDSSSGSFGQRVRTYDGYTLSDGAIRIDGNDLTGVGEITIPEVDGGMYIFVQASQSPSFITEVNGNNVTNYGLKAADGTVLSGIGGTGSDIFSVKSGVYLYQNTTGSKQDIVVPFSGSAEVQTVAVTDITKGIDEFGYASESRDRAIDHTYEGTLTTNDVNAYIISDAENSEYGSTYNYKGYPEVKKKRVETDIVPPNMGIVLYKDNHSGGTFTSPLFVPAVNNAPAYDAGSDVFWQSNWMIPNVQSKRHYNEETSRSAAAETTLNTLPYYNNGSIGTPDWNLEQTSNPTIFGSYSSDPVRYVDLSGFKELRIYQTDNNPAVRCFFYNADGSSYVSVSTTSIPSDAPTLTQVGSGESQYYSVDLKAVYDKYGQVKLIGIKAATSNGSAYVTDIKAISYVKSDPTWCTKFIMTTSYYTYSDVSNSFSEQKTAEVESFYRMILDKNESTAAANNTLAANKALLLIPRDNLPTALWNKTSGSGSGARRGVIYIDLEEFEENEATNVDEEAIIDCQLDSNVYYSISGARINGRPTAKGVYIHNGQKVSIK